VDHDLRVRAHPVDTDPDILLRADPAEGRATSPADRVREATEHEDPRAVPRRWTPEEPDNASRVHVKRAFLYAERIWSSRRSFS
jgi:hypothetical protein